MKQPYVGITGVTNDSELEEVLSIFESAGFKPQASHTGMVGFLAGAHTLRGLPQTKRHVSDVGALERLTQKTAGRALPVIHYEINGEDTTFSGPLIRIFRNMYKAGICRTAQLNGTPSKQEVDALMNVFPEMNLIYQIRPEILPQGSAKVAANIMQHRKAFQYVLIDPSCGRGKDIEPMQAAMMHADLRKHFPDVMFGFAGGFSGDNARSRVSALAGLLGHMNFSVDAEGRLRDMRDDLHLPAVRSYVQESRAGFPVPLS